MTCNADERLEGLTKGDADNAWFSNEEGTYHPHKDALRCVPCNYARPAPSLCWP